MNTDKCAPYPVLYSFRRCPYAMRARLALRVSQQVCELREVVLADKPPALLAASPKATVPVLVLPPDTVNGGFEVIEQSLDIMQWALQRHDPEHWLPHGEALALSLQLIAQCDGEFKQHLDRYKYPQRYELAHLSAQDMPREKGAAWLKQLEALLQVNTFLTAPHFSLADAALAPFVRQFAHTNPAWFASQPWPRLNTWLVNFEGSTAFQAVMKKHSQWSPDQAAVLFP